MSADHESSYYEIALTNRQVLTIFVVLLTCLVAAFLSGVWIGRRDGTEAPLQVAAAESPAEQATAQMTELNFFTDGPSRDGGGEPTTKAPPPAQEKRPEPAVVESKPPPQTAAVEKPAPPPASAPAPAAVAGPTAAGRVIQVFSTQNAEQADKLVKRLGDGGYPAYLVEENLQGRTTYRVRVGPYQQEARAQKIADELRREYRLETWITSQPG